MYPSSHASTSSLVVPVLAAVGQLIADLVAVLNQVMIEQVGTPQELREKPATPFVAEFLNSAALGHAPQERHTSLSNVVNLH